MIRTEQVWQAVKLIDGRYGVDQLTRRVIDRHTGSPAIGRVYAHGGDAPTDNNPMGNAIRPITLGKRNWLLAGSEAYGRRDPEVAWHCEAEKHRGTELADGYAEKATNLTEHPDLRIAATATPTATAALI